MSKEELADPEVLLCSCAAESNVASPVPTFLATCMMLQGMDSCMVCTYIIYD